MARPEQEALIQNSAIDRDGERRPSTMDKSPTDRADTSATTVRTVIASHRSAYPEPITFEAGAVLTTGERYVGEEGWENWVWCSTADGMGGWVPVQLLEFASDHTARALQHYTARELDVDPGDVVRVLRALNGWAWCRRTRDPSAGWVPTRNLDSPAP
jgi:hypothetical protein